jgi:hypothetical protein
MTENSVMILKMVEWTSMMVVVVVVVRQAHQGQM